MNYYIYDCFGELVGNPKGYRTYSGAARQEKRLYRALWDAFDKMKEIKPQNILICRIRQGKLA